MKHDKMAKLLAKKKDRPMDDLEKQAKMSVIKDMGNSAMRDLAGKLHGLKKVTVASDSKEGLQKGLEKAEELLSNMPNGEQLEESDESMEESEDQEMSSDEDMSEEEINAELERLMQKKQMLENKKKVY